MDEVRPLHEKLFAHKDDPSWSLHYVYAAVSMFWLTEYIAWYDENLQDPLLVNVDIAAGTFLP